MATKKKLEVVDRDKGEEELEELIDPTLLDKVDLTLPGEYEAEMFAVDLLDHISNYHKMELSRKAARHQAQHDRAEQFAKQMLFNRTAAAMIQAAYPEAKKIADELATLRSRQAAKQREIQLSGDEDD